MNRRGARCSTVLLAALMLLYSTAVSGQDAEPLQTISLEQVGQQITNLNADVTLAEPLRQSILKNLQQASENLQRAKALTATAAEYEQQTRQAPSSLAAIKLELAEPAKPVKLEIDPAKTLAAWEQELLKATAESDAARQKLADLEAEDKKRTARRSELPSQLAAATALRDELLDKLALPSGETDEPALLTQSARWALLSAKQAAEAQISAYEQEQQGFDTLRELLTARRDRAARRLGTAEALAAALQTQVNQQRHAESEAAAEKANAAKKAAAQLHPAIQAIADRNAELAALRTGEGGLATRLRNASRELQEAKDLTTAIQARTEELKQRISAAGLTHAVAQLLRRERDNLPDIRRYRPRIRARREQIAQVQLDLLDFNDQRSELVDIGNKVKAMADTINAPDMKRPELEALLTEYLTAQRDQLDTLIAENNTYFSTLVDLDTAERQLIDSVDSLSESIAEHILWVRSDPPFGWRTLRQAGNGLVWLARPAHWRELAQVILNNLQRNPLVLLVLLLSEALLVFYCRFASQRLKTIASATVRIRTDRFLYTIETLIHTAMRTIPIPLAFFVLGWWLSQPGSTSAPFAEAVGEALERSSLVLAAHLALYEACVPKGLMEMHFDWEPPALMRLHNAIMRLVLSAIPTLFFTTLLTNSTEPSETKMLERVLFATLQAILIAFAFSLLRRKSEFIKTLTAEMKDHRLLYSRRLVLALSLLLPSTIFVADAVGYYYTAEQMATWVTKSIMLAFCILLLEALLVRGIQVVARRLEFERRVKERQEAFRHKEDEEEEGPEIPPEEEGFDVVAISASTQKLLHVSAGFALLFGMWFIWVDAVPALNLFDRIVLWTVQTKSSGPDGAMLPVAISLADLITAVVVGMIAIVAARNLPGLLELAVLRQLRMGYGERYAISTIVRYVTVGTGIALTFSKLGIGWSEIRWLVAALSVGLGFGLQEIFANFVSGLILLFERPIRVRDYVTVGGTSGVVTRIQIRATTVTDFDNKELLIPNKQFVTGELVNWTLTNAVLRIVVPVGIAYGSDTKKACRILLDVAKKCQLAVEDPAPSAHFVGFGDSSLNFELRVFISPAERFREARHELHMAVDDAFRKAGIVIAFPQRDIHVYPVGEEIRREDIVVPEKK